MPIFHRDSAASSSSGSRRSAEAPNHRPSSNIFSSRSSQSSATSSGGSRHRRSSISRHTPEDPSIKAAQERVFRAEAAEREADRALIASKRAVQEARDHVKYLEREAAEEARLAKIKQNQAKSISKRAKPLGQDANQLPNSMILCDREQWTNDVELYAPGYLALEAEGLGGEYPFTSLAAPESVGSIKKQVMTKVLDPSFTHPNFSFITPSRFP
ncbi:hypothetical protein N7468_008499 [Penicillium chermesinum]|uniref:Uncharacterized protein n=1 Tax=Penicillium chermesinum TaxID=63820 RepID=A0A9W9NPX8_9EURO|nr:uncharacterized protein N7468_008499 [Penicillium chermesinum]KAJ5223957.1 hypothetical protein N7468_008499 [Penicillium chermesinum]